MSMGGGLCPKKRRGSPCVMARDDDNNNNKRGNPDFMGTGDMNVRVGGDLTLSSGSPSSSTDEGGASGTLSCCHVGTASGLPLASSSAVSLANFNTNQPNLTTRR